MHVCLGLDHVHLLLYEFFAWRWGWGATVLTGRAKDPPPSLPSLCSLGPRLQPLLTHSRFLRSPSGFLKWSPTANACCLIVFLISSECKTATFYAYNMRDALDVDLVAPDVTHSREPSLADLQTTVDAEAFEGFCPKTSPFLPQLVIRETMACSEPETVVAAIQVSALGKLGFFSIQECLQRQLGYKIVEMREDPILQFARDVDNPSGAGCEVHNGYKILRYFWKPNGR
ncbi:uncharacterized protein PpBr36_11043 [Pyricularia pennisetigena]|uniref:uncharacterized protein n=1 Tax=Pyricularia pennisetigena TaxID=1578925 RepID=UPI00114E36E2|nr:uncharacterized protein PpBr36_11056 [Pyricularia pennisetigena]XP_029743620.1 uncharacterized protein PpBr36_11043 [Pyricularia pennisetigena]TLS20700.1 hypothetical protein PpBr36_11056 [Pyricularia pennisetigena]TLS20770.1 hypothetical protein PpBr36_11043 [Pyricularia pennisetigena]